MRERLLTVHGVSTERWTARHGIEPLTAPCQDCGAPRTTTVPVAFGPLRGLRAPVCECGSEAWPYCLVGDSLDEIFGG